MTGHTGFRFNLIMSGLTFYLYNEVRPSAATLGRHAFTSTRIARITGHSPRVWLPSTQPPNPEVGPPPKAQWGTRAERHVWQSADTGGRDASLPGSTLRTARAALAQQPAYSPPPSQTAHPRRRGAHRLVLLSRPLLVPHQVSTLALGDA